MKLKSILTIFACTALLCSCGGSRSRLAEIAEAYAQIGANQEKYAERYRALYEMSKEEQEAALNKLITVDYDGTLNCKPYFALMAGDEVVYRSLGSTNGNGQITVNFRINLKNAKQFTSVDALRIEGDGNINMAEVSNEEAEPEPEPAFISDEDGNSVQSANIAGNEIKVGVNLADALRNASNVTYEYNADSGIWATIGDIAIVIDEDQLNQKGIDFLSTIYSDIAPDITFKPEYVKPDAKIKQIEKQ